MQIVIEISEEEYKCVQLTGHIGNATAISNAILNSTPLPKHHGDLKDVNSFEASCFMGSSMYYTQSDIEYAETIIPATKEGE